MCNFFNLAAMSTYPTFCPLVPSLFILLGTEHKICLGDTDDYNSCELSS